MAPHDLYASQFNGVHDVVQRGELAVTPQVQTVVGAYAWARAAYGVMSVCSKNGWVH